MIRITITGNTYPWREKYKRLGFRWDGHNRAWWKLEREAMLNETMEALREDIPPKVQITLTFTDIKGNQINPGSLVIKELAVKTADAERRVRDWLTTLRKYDITNGYLRPKNRPAKPDDQGADTNTDDEKERRLTVDPDFF